MHLVHGGDCYHEPVGYHYYGTLLATPDGEPMGDGAEMRVLYLGRFPRCLDQCCLQPPAGFARLAVHLPALSILPGSMSSRPNEECEPLAARWHSSDEGLQFLAR